MISKSKTKIKKYIENKGLQDQIEIITTKDLKYKLDSSIDKIIKENGGKVCILFDIDDTLCPKFLDAQQKALDELITQFKNDKIFDKEEANTLLNYQKLAKNVQGTEHKIVYLINYILIIQVVLIFQIY